MTSLIQTEFRLKYFSQNEEKCVFLQRRTVHPCRFQFKVTAPKHVKLCPIFWAQGCYYLAKIADLGTTTTATANNCKQLKISYSDATFAYFVWSEPIGGE